MRFKLIELDKIEAYLSINRPIFILLAVDWDEIGLKISPIMLKLAHRVKLARTVNPVLMQIGIISLLSATASET